MKNKPIDDKKLTVVAAGNVPATRGMLRERAVELAVCGGRLAQDVSKSDWDQAKWEMTGEASPVFDESLPESSPGPERWGPVCRQSNSNTSSPFL